MARDLWRRSRTSFPTCLVCELTPAPVYTLSYAKKTDLIVVSAPNKDDAKELFEWLKGLIFP